VKSWFIIYIYIGLAVRRIAGAVGRGNVQGAVAGWMRGWGMLTFHQRAQLRASTRPLASMAAKIAVVVVPRAG
jgi:hypothetical protein